MFILGYVILTIVSFAIAAFLKINLKFKIWILAILMGLFGYFIVPSVTSKIDALPYLYTLNAVRAKLYTKGVSAAWNMLAVGGGETIGKVSTSIGFRPMTFQATPVMGIVMFTCAFFPNPFFLFIVAFIDYFFALKIIELIVKKNNLSNLDFALTYLVFMCLFVYTNAVGGVRNNLVGTIYAYVYLHYIEKKPKIISCSTIWLILMASILSLIHPFTIILFVFSMFSLILNKVWQLRLVNVLLLFQRFFQQRLLTFIKPLSVIPFVGSILLKSDQYLGENITLFISSRANWIRDFARLFVMIAILILVRKKCRTMIGNTYIEFIIMLICYAVGSIQDQVIFERCLLVLLPMMLPILTCLPSLTFNGLHQFTSTDMIKFLLLISLVVYISICFIDNLRAGELYYTFLFNSSPVISGF